MEIFETVIPKPFLVSEFSIPPLRHSVSTNSHQNEGETGQAMALPTIFSQYPRTLLLKRGSSENLDDLVLKKTKTFSTYYSDCDPNLSPLKETDQLENQQTLFLNRYASLTSSTNMKNDAKGADLFTDKWPFLNKEPSEPQIPLLNSSLDLEQQNNSAQSLLFSLEILKGKLLMQRLGETLIRNLTEKQENPLIKVSPEGALKESFQHSLDTIRKQMKKKLPGELEGGIEVTYGDIEFPFLSVSAPFRESSLCDLEKNLEEKISKPLQMKKSNHEQEKVILSKTVVKTKGTIVKTKEAVVKTKEATVMKVETHRFKKKLLSQILPKKNELKMKENIKEKGTSLGKKTKEESQKNKGKKLFFSFYFGRKKKLERKKNKWQISQDIKLGDIKVEVNSSSNDHSFMFKGHKNKETASIGSQHQADLGSCLAESEKFRPRKPQLKWDPSCFREAIFNKFFKEVESITKLPLNQEKIIGYWLQNGKNFQNTKKYIKENKAKARQDLSLKMLK